MNKRVAKCEQRIYYKRGVQALVWACEEIRQARGTRKRFVMAVYTHCWNVENGPLCKPCHMSRTCEDLVTGKTSTDETALIPSFKSIEVDIPRMDMMMVV